MQTDPALPTITKLTPGVRDPNRVNVFLDGKFAFSLDLAQVVDLGVKRGQQLSPERLAQLRAASEYGKLYQRTLEWVLTRPHSVAETRDYLRRRQQRRRQLNLQRARADQPPLPELNPDTMELVITRLIERGYLDDAKFAAYFLENRHQRRGISPRRLRQELLQKGVSADLIDAAFAAVSRPADQEILKLLQKKRARYDDPHLINYLVRQGFDYAAARAAVQAHPAPGSDPDALPPGSY